MLTSYFFLNSAFAHFISGICKFFLIWHLRSIVSSCPYRETGLRLSQRRVCRAALQPRHSMYYKPITRRFVGATSSNEKLPSHHGVNHMCKPIQFLRLPSVRFHGTGSIQRFIQQEGPKCSSNSTITSQCSDEPWVHASRTIMYKISFRLNDSSQNTRRTCGTLWKIARSLRRNHNALVLANGSSWRKQPRKTLELV